MRADADAAGDDWLRMQADLVERRVEQHWPGHADGCEVCYGEGMHACPEWTHAINIGITWMLTTRAVSR